MLINNRKHQEEQKETKDVKKDHHKARKLSHEAAAQIMDQEWKHHPGGG